MLERARFANFRVLEILFAFAAALAVASGDAIIGYEGAVIDLHGEATKNHNNRYFGLNAEENATINIHMPLKPTLDECTQEGVQEELRHKASRGKIYIHTDYDF